MTAPKKIKIGYKVYDVVWSKEPILHDGQRVDGLHSFSQDKLFIDASKKGAYAKDVLMHEILHGIFDIWDIKTTDGEERVVTAISTGLVTVLNDNPQLRKYLT